MGKWGRPCFLPQLDNYWGSHRGQGGQEDAGVVPEARSTSSNVLLRVSCWPENIKAVTWGNQKMAPGNNRDHRMVSTHATLKTCQYLAITQRPPNLHALATGRFISVHFSPQWLHCTLPFLERPSSWPFYAIGTCHSFRLQCSLCFCPHTSPSERHPRALCLKPPGPTTL